MIYKKVSVEGTIFKVLDKSETTMKIQSEDFLTHFKYKITNQGMP